MSHVIRIEGVNPTPWTAPTLSAGRKGGRVFPIASKKAELRTYQEAIKEELQNGGWPMLMPILEPVRLEFYFWRRIEKYENAAGKAVRKHRADATNLQKALEDALQGIVIKNDSQVQSILSTIVEEGDDVEPYILIVVSDEDSIEQSRHVGEANRNEQ